MLKTFRSKSFWRSSLFMLILIVVSSVSARWFSPLPSTPASRSAIAQVEDNPLFTATHPAAPEHPPDLFDELLQPFVASALKARAERARKDPDYTQRIDAELNQRRITFLLLGYGETYEPPLPNDVIGTITIMSLDYRALKFSQISLTHDARAPEIERHMQQRGLKPHPSKIDTTYRNGGFELMRLTVENATGLAIDFQLVAEDVLIRHLVDDVLGSIEVDNPIELATNPIYIQGVRYPCRAFPKGRQQFDGLKSMCYLKGLSLPPYDPAKENNIRKHVVFQAISNSVEQNAKNPLFAIKMLALLQSQLDRKAIEYDFDAKTLLFDSIKQLASNPIVRPMTIPRIDQNIYLVDEHIGDGGFSWVMGTQNPIIRGELKQGYYVDTAMVVTSGDPYARDLAKGYWGSVRSIVKSKLMGTDRFILPLPTRLTPMQRGTRQRPY